MYAQAKDLERILRKILIVTYDWPPRNSIATHRPYSWARYWAAQGLDVTVLTAQKKFFDQPLDLDLPKLDGVKVVEADYKVMIPSSNSVQQQTLSKFIKPLKKIKNIISAITGWEYDVRSNWTSTAEASIKKIGTDFDVVISTYGPDSAHKIASKFKKANPLIYWVADYRDLWSQNSRKKDSYFSRIFMKRSELSIVNQADMFTTVSEELAQTLKNLVKITPEVIYNGFDIDVNKENYNKPLVVKDGCLHIVYTGRIYPNKRNPMPLIKAIDFLIDRGLIESDQVVIDFYGGNTEIINDEIGLLRHPEIVKHHGHVTRDKVLEIQKSADLLLLMESGDDDSKGFLTGKIFEYIGAGRPIISIGSSADSAIARVLNETKMGVCHENSSESLANDLLNYLNEVKLDWYNPNISAINKYSRNYQAQLLTEKIVSCKVKNDK
jgi:hypothetical protein